MTSLDTAVSALRHGLGYGWLPWHLIAEPLAAGDLKPLPLREGQTYRTPLYLVFPAPDRVGPATRQLADILQTMVTGALGEAPDREFRHNAPLSGAD